MKFPVFFGRATYQADLMGLGVMLALTAAAAAVVATPRLVTKGATPEEQLASLNTRGRVAEDLERAIHTARARRTELLAESKTTVQLVGVDRMNERLSRLDEIARSGGGDDDAVGPFQGIVFTQMTPGSPTTEGKNVVLPIKLAASGTYTQISGLIHRLHEEFRDTAVTSLRLAGAPAADSATLEFTMDLCWYALPATPAASSATPPTPAGPTGAAVQAKAADGAGVAGLADAAVHAGAPSK